MKIWHGISLLGVWHEISLVEFGSKFGRHCHSGQCQLCVHVGDRDYLWWCHLDNIDELKPCNYNDDSFEFGIDQHNESNNTYFPFTNSSPSFRE